MWCGWLRPRLALELHPCCAGGLPKGWFLLLAGRKPNFKAELCFPAPFFETPVVFFLEHRTCTAIPLMFQQGKLRHEGKSKASCVAPCVPQTNQVQPEGCWVPHLPPACGCPCLELLTSSPWGPFCSSDVALSPSISHTLHWCCEAFKGGELCSIQSMGAPACQDQRKSMNF